MEQHDKQHLQNIDKVEIHNHNHVDTAEILSLLNIIKLQNHKIKSLLLSSKKDEELKVEIMQKLNKAIADIKSTI